MRLLTTIATTLAQYHQFNATLRELNARSDRELADMGVDRGDIARLAWQEAERRFPLPAEAGDRQATPRRRRAASSSRWPASARPTARPPAATRCPSAP